MGLSITIGAVLTLLVLGMVGYVRDIRRGIVALAGALLGTLLVSFWADRWAQSLAERFGSTDPKALLQVVSILTFLLTTLIIGYGGGMLLGKAKDPPPMARRLVAGLLGLVNGAIIVGYVLRFAAINSPETLAAIQVSPIGRLLHDGLPLLFLGVALVVAALVGVRALLLATGLGLPQARTETKAGEGGKPRSSQEMQRQVMDKIEQKTGAR